MSNVTKVYQVVFWDGTADVTKGFYSTLERAQNAQKSTTEKHVVAGATIMDHWVEVDRANQPIYLCIGHTEDSRVTLVTTSPAQVQNFINDYSDQNGWCHPIVFTFILD
jgi:hypothetical protein